MAFTPTFLLMLVNTSYGVTLSDRTRRKMALVFGATPIQIFIKVIAMDALPQIFVGLRLALTQSLIVTVVSEMFIGTEFGLGQRVFDSYLTSSLSSLYALLIILGLFGYFTNKLLMLVERKVVFWTVE
jgi:ABC-type nitrate/sulfonate/bicarbonate transport system permease component